MSLVGKTSPHDILRGRINGLKTITLSAYAIAVKHGFKGTEEEWLASLKGEPGEGIVTMLLNLDAEDFTQGDGCFTYSESPAWDWLTSADNIDFELTCVINGETYVYKKEDLYLDFSNGAFWGFSAPKLTDPDAGVWASPGMYIGNRDGSFCVEVTMGSNNTGVFIMESCSLKVYRKRNFVQTVNGIAPDESGNVEVEGGIGSAEKKLILSLFKAAAYTEDVSAKVAELEALWSVSYKVAYSLTGVTASNNAVAVVEGGAYSSALTAEGGYTLTGATVKITMGGVDITSEVYSGGVITIAEVTGDVVISVVAKEIPSYTITNNLTGVTTDNSATKVSEGGSYTANLTVDEGYFLNTLTITMGGVDITADVYGEGYILIPEVTGDVVITAVAEEPVVVETFSGSASTTKLYAGETTDNLVATKYNSNVIISKRSVDANSTVNITYTNDTESAVTVNLIAAAVARNSGYAFKIQNVDAYHAKTLVSGLSVAAGTSHSVQYTIPAGYHLCLWVGSHDASAFTITGAVNIHEPVNEYNFVTATPATNWSLYSGDTITDTAAQTWKPKYMTENAFAEDTTVRIIVLNTSDASVNMSIASYYALIATYGDGTNAVGYNLKAVNANNYVMSLHSGAEGYDAEYTIPAGYHLATGIAPEHFFVEKIS